MNCWLVNPHDYADPPRPPWLPWAWAAIAVVVVAFWWAVTVAVGGWV